MSIILKSGVELLAITPDCERLIESCGRTCYESYDKVTEDSHIKIIRHLLKNGHTSVFEHASATFRFTNVSRSLTHQLVRHRIASYSQKSQRYVKENDFDFITPDAIIDNGDALAKYHDCMKFIEEIYNDLVALGIRKEDARYVLPNACTTTIDTTLNFRSLFNLFDLRGDIHAQWEIRRKVMAMLVLVKEHAPTVFEGYENDYEKEIIRRV
jgi:thymidylate synthase (FAD)